MQDLLDMEDEDYAQLDFKKNALKRLKRSLAQYKLTHEDSQVPTVAPSRFIRPQRHVRFASVVRGANPAAYAHRGEQTCLRTTSRA